MKRIKHIILLISFLSIVAGCEKWIDPDMNIDPNKAPDVTMSALLPGIEASTAFKMVNGTVIQRIQAMWLQQLDGTAGQSMAEANYILLPSSFSLIWEHCYVEMLINARTLKEKAIEKESPHNFGVANILIAFILGQMTDVWDDIPWDEALQGEENFQAKFDTQESIYEEIQNLLNEAISDLENPEDPFGIDGDYIYSGNVDKWLKAAHALKARYLLHLEKKKGDQVFHDALDELPFAFMGNEDDMQFDYTTANHVENNPLAQFMRLPAEQVRLGAFFIELLKSYDDPRITVYAMPDNNGEYTGSEPGSGNTEASEPGVAVAAPDAPSYFITYVEVLFIKAEALFKTGQNETDVKEALLSAVAASLEKNGVMDETWFAGYSDDVNTLIGDDLYKEIMTQKYIATFYQPETYHSWRRTGIPELIPNPNGATTQIPRRFLYPSSEQLYNPNTPAGIQITDRVWWDE